MYIMALKVTIFTVCMYITNFKKGQYQYALVFRSLNLTYPQREAPLSVYWTSLPNTTQCDICTAGGMTPAGCEVSYQLQTNESHTSTSSLWQQSWQYKLPISTAHLGGRGGN